MRLTTDVLVIGGGATGAGVLRDLAMRGFDAILVERGDLATGTTGRFHGLLHSGGRYVVKDPKAAVECIHENRVLRRIAADCIEDTGGLFVTTPLDDPAYADKFVAGCERCDIPCEEISVGDASARAAAEPEDHAGPSSSPTHRSTRGRRCGPRCARPRSTAARVLPYNEVICARDGGEGGADVVGAVVRDHRSGEETRDQRRAAWSTPPGPGPGGSRPSPGRRSRSCRARGS